MALSRRRFLSESARLAAASSLLPRSLRAQTGAPIGAPDAYARPKPAIPGPFQPTWESLRDNYSTPAWFNQAKFGIFIHWGLYSIPARINEWYERHMYTSDADWHTQHYGAPDKFGYKDFIPLFTVPKYDPEAWAQLFRSAGANYVVPVAEHHDGFAMWDSDITPWCAGKMGPKRDLTGELATAVRKQNMVFGLSSHRMEHAYFGYPAPNVPNDEFDPRYAGFYGPPIDQPFNSANNSKIFQEDWLARVQELVDKYQPQLLYFDNGVNPRAYDDVKLRAAAYYYNRARQWRKEVTLATKDVAYLAGSVQDFEKAQRMPRWIYPSAWQVDDSIGNTWGYTESPRPMTIRSAASIVAELFEIASQGGNLMLNVSPMGDGSIPEVQQNELLAVGDWLRPNGEGIYGSRPWRIMGEGPGVPLTCPPDWRGGSTDDQTNTIKGARPAATITEANFRFTTAGNALYAFGYKYPAAVPTPSGYLPPPRARILSLSLANAKVERVTLLGTLSKQVDFVQTAEALVVTLPHASYASHMPYTLRIEGSQGLAPA
jgi:alpha-L-fucosidase